MKRTKWIDLTEIIERDFFNDKRAGQILRFEKADIKIVRIAANGKVWGQIIFTYAPEEVDIVDKT